MSEVSRELSGGVSLAQLLGQQHRWKAFGLKRQMSILCKKLPSLGKAAQEASEALVLHLSHFPDDESAARFPRGALKKRLHRRNALSLKFRQKRTKQCAKLPRH